MFIVFLVPHIILSKQSVIFVSCYYLSYLFTQVTGRTRRLLQKQWTFHSGGFLLTATSSPSTTPLTWALCELSTPPAVQSLPSDTSEISSLHPPPTPTFPSFPSQAPQLTLGRLGPDYYTPSPTFPPPPPLCIPSASPLHPSGSCSSSVFSFHVLHLILSFSPSLHLLNPIVLPIPSSSSLFIILVILLGVLHWTIILAR